MVLLSGSTRAVKRLVRIPSDIMSQEIQPLTDRFGRIHTSLRISVTDRCNIRCFYCMPDENIVFKPRSELLTYDEICRFVDAVSPAGISKLRLTGGEPLVRNDISELIKLLAERDGIDDLALTTNGILLDQFAEPLKRAGLDRINISLDTLDEEVFERITRRSGLDRVITGIEAAMDAGFTKIRLNAIAMKDLTEDQIVPLANFAKERNLELRFIEFMPLDAENAWNSDSVLSGKKIKATLEKELGNLRPVHGTDIHQPAVDYEFKNGGPRVGFINSVTEPFCDNCNRLRITAEGQLRNCLFSTTEWDARKLLRGGAASEDIVQLVRDCVAAKKPGHGIDTWEFQRPERAMYQIGG